MALRHGDGVCVCVCVCVFYHCHLLLCSGIIQKIMYTKNKYIMSERQQARPDSEKPGRIYMNTHGLVFRLCSDTPDLLTAVEPVRKKKNIIKCFCFRYSHNEVQQICHQETN